MDIAMPAGLAFALAVPIALAVDRQWGEPPAWAHPVVGMGAYLQVLGPRITGLAPVWAWGAGTLAWCFAAAALVALGAWLEQALRVAPAWTAALVLGVLLKPLLALRCLLEEVAAVEKALAVSLDQGRAQLARLVSRNTARLSATEVREAALETLAENLNDAVVAPLFWWLLAGLPGALVYRFANTADAMWGYRGRYTWAGWCAARADDVLSWWPARLTAMLLCLAAGRWPGWRVLRGEAAATPSPNGGWPMGALARLSGCGLAKPGVYALNPAGRAPTHDDLARALGWARRAAWLAGALCGGLLVFRGGTIALPLTAGLCAFAALGVAAHVRAVRPQDVR